MTHGSPERLLAALAPGELASLVPALLERLPADIALAQAVATALAAAGAADDRLLETLGRIGTPSAHAALAQILEATDSAAAVAHWERSRELLAEPNAGVLLALARLYAHSGDMGRGVGTLREAVAAAHGLDLAAKAYRLFRRIRDSGEWRPKRTVRAALLGGPNLSFLRMSYELALFAEDVRAETYEGPFGQFRQEILNPGSGLYAAEPAVVAIVPHWRDAGLEPYAETAESDARALAEEMRGLWGRLLGQRPCQVLQCLFAPPPEHGWGNLRFGGQRGLGSALRVANVEMVRQAPPQVVFVDPAPLGMDESLLSWCKTRQAWDAESESRLAWQLAHATRGAMGFSRKLLVLDLDNTLWGGVIGEDGLAGIRLGPPSAVGEGYQLLQRVLKDLKERGIVLAVCSKNNEADAKLPFERHPEMVLSLNDIAAFVADWDDKASGIIRIAERLSLGLDSFVFLDDNGVERAWVRERLPSVAVPEVEATPWSMVEALDRGAYFEATKVTEEDLLRAGSYRAEAERVSFRQSAEGMGDFLAGLRMEMRHGPVSELTVARAAQLVSRTNQFNLTARRYSESDVRAFGASPEWWTRWFSLRDRFGDYGVIGLVLVHAPEGSGEWRIDTWVLSCRVLGRGVEEAIVGVVRDAAASRGCRVLIGEYVETDRNSQVRDLYDRLGFEPDAARPGRYVLNLSSLAEPAASPIECVPVE